MPVVPLFQFLRSLSLRGKMLLLVSVLLALMGGLSFITYQTTAASREAQAWVTHTNEVTTLASEALAGLVDMETGYRGFLITGEDEFLEPYEAGRRIYRQRLVTLTEITADNPTQVVRWEDLRSRSSAWSMAIVLVAVVNWP